MVTKTSLKSLVPDLLVKYYLIYGVKNRNRFVPLFLVAKYGNFTQIYNVCKKKSLDCIGLRRVNIPLCTGPEGIHDFQNKTYMNV